MVYFPEVGRQENLGLKLLQVWTNLTTVLLVEGKVGKFGLKLRIEKTKVATHIWQQKILKSCKNILFKMNSFKKTRKARFVLKKWAHFSSKWVGLKYRLGQTWDHKITYTYPPLHTLPDDRRSISRNVVEKHDSRHDKLGKQCEYN